MPNGVPVLCLRSQIRVGAIEICQLQKYEHLAQNQTQWLLTSLTVCESLRNK
jgi:hypothetical protein